MIKLWENTPDFNPEFPWEEPCMLDYTVEESKCAVLVIPGGGYHGRAEDHEGVKVAKAFNSYGISAFILRYRCYPYHHPIMQNDVNRAMRVVRSLASKYGYDEDKIAVLGFSAGGHLAGTAATRFDYGRDDGDEIDKISCRPDLGVLCYPVVTIEKEFTHKGTADALLGPDGTPELAHELSLENAVKDDTPPCFIWHTFEDRIVPVENSLLFASALVEKNIHCELHIYPFHDHGTGLADGDEHLSSWFKLCVEFIKLNFKL